MEKIVNFITHQGNYVGYLETQVISLKILVE